MSNGDATPDTSVQSVAHAANGTVTIRLWQMNNEHPQGRVIEVKVGEQDAARLCRQLGPAREKRS